MREGAVTLTARLYLLVLALVGFVGLLIAFIAATILPGNFLSVLLLSLGVSSLTSTIIFSLQRMVPSEYERTLRTLAEASQFSTIRGHEKIYEEYKRALRALPDGIPHRIRTTSSCVQDYGVRTDWDGFLRDFLTSHSNVRYTRILVRQDTKEWRDRISELAKIYTGINGYREYAHAGPPSVEFLLLDESVAYLTFASTLQPSETSGIIIKDPAICRELVNYCEVYLER